MTGLETLTDRWQDEDEWKVIKRLERKKGKSTFQEYERHCRQFREWLDGKSLFEADELDIEDCIIDMIYDGYSVSSVNIRHAALGEFFTEAERLNGKRIDVPLNGNPVEELPKLKEIKPYKDALNARESRDDGVWFLEPNDVRQVAENVPKPYTRNELLVRLCFQTGMRRNELVQIELEHVDFQNRVITIPPENAKNGEERKVGYQSTLDALMSHWIDTVRPTVAMASESDYLFPSNRSKHISGQTFNDVVVEAADNAGIQGTRMTNRAGEERAKVTAHVLRHSFAMAAKSNGWDIYALAKAMGHSSVSVTEETYLHDDNEYILNHYRDDGPGRQE
ncbi:tyrosine-type recombinase/integrase [Halostagnicola kamekurae]|uniref:tyrosine-type recombinase/integrase n=1 Tax=Halostagnicola kamekurae TaxID=619731 RepID=UPI000B824DEF|nr:tyrosine-type recombinase/integrase [Halostagnicola kamekurae]